MKKITAVIMIFVLCLSMCVSVYAEESPITVFIDEKQIDFDVEPIIENGRTLVPMRYIFEALDASVEWVGETSTAVAVKGDIRIEITIGSNQMLKNGEAVELDVGAKLLDGRTLVPVRAVSEGLNAKVEWDDELRRVIITSENTKQEGEAVEEKAVYDISQLSPADTKILMENKDSARYVFEQQILPQALFESEEGVIVALAAKSEGMESLVPGVWDRFLVSMVFQIQIDSEDSYEMEKITGNTDENALIENYMSILRNNKLNASEIMSCSYEGDVLLTTFNEVKADEEFIILCKHIAIMNDNGKLRYFTLELSPAGKELYGKDIYMVCEITADGRKSHKVLETDSKDAFLKAVDEIISK